MARPVSIFYGSQTGTAEETAWELAREGRRKGYAMEPQAMDETSVEKLRSIPVAIFVVSTTGQGDPPMNMRRLWQELLAANLPPTLLQGLCYAVFGLGDRRYREFNYAARKLHARLQTLGAQPFVRLGLGDDQHDFGMEQELDPWCEGMWSALSEKLPPGEPDEDVDLRYEVEELGEMENGDGHDELPAECFWAELLQNESLCSASHASEVQDVWNVRLRLPPQQRYAAGDVLVVWPTAEQGLVRRFVVETLERSLAEKVRIRPKSKGSTSPFPSRPMSLAEIFSRYIDVTAVPSRHFFHVLSQHTSDELHKKKLSEFASRTLEAKDALYEYCKRERRTAAEVMWDFWTARPPLNALLSVLPLLRPRRYSIASSPGWAGSGCYTAAWSLLSKPFWFQEKPSSCLARMVAEIWAGRAATSADLDLCVGIVNSVTRSNRQVKGLCSNFMKDAPVASRLQCSLERGTLQLPALQVPLILVCPGTGLSPCRALVQERHQQLMSCKCLPARFQNGLQDLIFLGFRHQDGDFLYGSEWSTFQSWLSVHVAFSRDHEDKKVYVQDLIEEQGQHVRRLLDAGGMIFVCGRSHPMPSQVFDAFVEVLQETMGKDAAISRLRAMQRSQHYICDTWG